MKRKIKIVILSLIVLLILAGVLLLIFQKEKLGEVSLSPQEREVKAVKDSCLKSPQPLMDAWIVELEILPEEERFGEWQVARLSANYNYCLAIENYDLGRCDKFLETISGEMIGETKEVAEDIRKERAQANYNICRRNYFFYYKIILPILEKRMPDETVCEEKNILNYIGGEKENCKLFLEGFSQRNAQPCSKIKNDLASSLCRAFVLRDQNWCDRLTEGDKENCEMMILFFRGLLDDDRKAVKEFIEKSKNRGKFNDEVEFIEQVRGLLYEGKTCRDIYEKRLKEQYCEMKAELYRLSKWGKYNPKK